MSLFRQTEYSKMQENYNKYLHPKMDKSHSQPTLSPSKLSTSPQRGKKFHVKGTSPNKQAGKKSKKHRLSVDGMKILSPLYLLNPYLYR